MKYEISKELFEAVMGKDYVFDAVLDVEIKYIFKKETIAYIAINDFFFKCKEWALENAFDLRSYIGKYQDSGTLFGSAVITSLNFDTPNHMGFIGNTEQEAIFEACQYILDNKGTK